MTARFEVSGKLMADPQSTVIGAEPMTGAAVVARVPFDPEVPNGEAGELVVFLTAPRERGPKSPGELPSR